MTREATTFLFSGCRHVEGYMESLNDAMKMDGWLWHATYSCEGDNVRVIERDTDDA